jgi:dephospho-CoA kinase
LANDRDVRAIGLTGGIGSGKSTVARLLSERGAEVIHADLVGHQVYLPRTDGWAELVDAFGRGVVATDGTIDRKRLAAIVFSDPEALKRLNSIVHPKIRREIERRISQARDAGLRLPMVIEAAILIEAGWVSLVDEVWLVVASREAVVERLCAERGLRSSEVEARLAAQLKDDERRKYAQVVIENSGSLDQLEARVDDAWKRVVAS